MVQNRWDNEGNSPIHNLVLRSLVRDEQANILHLGVRGNANPNLLCVYGNQLS